MSNSLTALSLISPNTISEQEFQVTPIDADNLTEIKIFIHNSSDSVKRNEILSEIYSDGWKSSWFYVPLESTHRIKILSSQTSQINASICIQSRSGDKACNSISFIPIIPKSTPVISYSNNSLLYSISIFSSLFSIIILFFILKRII